MHYVKHYILSKLPVKRGTNIMRFTSHRGAIAALALLCSAFNPQARAEEPEIAVVVKIGGIPWFTAMEQGIKKAGEENHVKAYMVGPTTADPAQQVRAVEDLIAKKVSAIGVVPNDAKALEPVFDRAKTAGIPIITHESPDQKGNVWDIETPIVDGMDIPGLGKASVDPEKRI